MIANLLVKPLKMATKSLVSRTSTSLLTCRRFGLTSRKKSLWTPDKIVKSPHQNIEIPNRTVTEHIWENLERWADKTAMVCALTNRSYTYHELQRYSRNFAAKLRTQLRLEDGDVVCVMMPNSPEYPIATLGALEAGAAVTPINPIYTAYEVYKLLTSNPKVFIGNAETVQVIKEALTLAKMDVPIICVKGSEKTIPQGTISFEEFAQADNVDHSVLKEVASKSEDIAFLPYSSGTTGLPKGVELVHRNIVVNCMQMDVDTVKHYNDTNKTNQDTGLGVIPFFHIYGLTSLLLHKLSVGFKLVTVPRFQPKTFLKALEDHKITLLYVAPPLVLFIGSHADVTKKHLQSIRTMLSAAAPLLPNDVNKVLEKVTPGMNLLQLYGLTETSPAATMTLPGSIQYSSTGNALPNTELRIVNSESKPLGPDEVGELLIRGPQVMKGYRNNPEATRAAMTEDGWFKSGDLASIGPNGVVTIADRLKELIKVKGYQVPPAELENVLKGHPDVLDAGVVGVPDARMGEAPKAFVVLKEGRKIDPKEVTAFVAERVAEYKRLKDVIFLDVLPKNPSGKLLRRVLKEKYA